MGEEFADMEINNFVILMGKVEQLGMEMSGDRGRRLQDSTERSLRVMVQLMGLSVCRNIVN
jgi:hypothetical protein